MKKGKAKKGRPSLRAALLAFAARCREVEAELGAAIKASEARARAESRNREAQAPPRHA